MEEFIKKLTKNAGDLVLPNFKKEKDLLSLRKGSKDVVTKYDKDADNYIVSEINKRYPEHGILTEESGFNGKKSDYLWIVDSLDGSGNFANGNPLFSVCIALSYREELILTSTYAPAIDEFYFAKKDKGAFLNGKRINVSSTKKVKDSYVAFCDGHEKDRKKLSGKLSLVFENAIDLRKLGSAGIEAGWVAMGRLDAFLMFEGDPWDLASGVLIVREAGGRVSDIKNDKWKRERGSFIFSNKKIHEEIRSLIQ